MRIFLGEQAFSLYFGDSIRDWVLHCIDFAFVPTTLLLSDTFLFDSIIPVCCNLRLYLRTQRCLQITTPMLFIPANFIMNENSRAYAGWLKFPPTPAMTMFAWPYARICYNYGKHCGGSTLMTNALKMSHSMGSRGETGHREKSGGFTWPATTRPRNTSCSEG